MANFSSLKQAIQNYIKENGNNEITGTLLQSILLSMVTTIGDGAVNDLESDVSDINSDITDINGALTASVQFTGGSLVFKNANDTVLYSIAVSTFLDGIVARLDSGAVYAGYAAPSTTPDTLAGQKVFYVATQAGTYIHFLYNGDTPITLAKDGIYFIVSGAGADDWNAEPIQQLDDVPTPNSNNPIKSGAVLRSIIQDGSAFDLSAHNAVGGVLATYADLSAALTALNSLDDVYKQPGMSFKFVRTSDNKYVQCRYMSTAVTGNPNPFLDIANWQGVDTELVAGSHNLAESGAVAPYLPYAKKVLNSVQQQLNYICFDWNIPAGTTLSFKVTGTAEWSRAWVSYDNNAHRLQDYVVKGTTYEITLENSVSNIGFDAYTLTTNGTVIVEMSVVRTPLENSLKNSLALNIDDTLSVLPIAFSYSRNQFNPNDPDLIPNHRLNSLGDEVEDELYNITGYIPLTEGIGTLVLSDNGIAVTLGGSYVCLYDSSKNLVASGQIGAWQGKAVWQENVFFARFSVSKSANIQIEQGTIVHPYVPFGVVSNDKLPLDSSLSLVSDNLVKNKDVSIAIANKLGVDSTEKSSLLIWEVGYRQTSGVTTTINGYWHSEFNIKKGDKIQATMPYALGKLMPAILRKVDGVYYNLLTFDSQYSSYSYVATEDMTVCVNFRNNASTFDGTGFSWLNPSIYDILDEEDNISTVVGKNLLNPATVKTGYYLNSAGTETENPNSTISDYIPFTEEMENLIMSGNGKIYNIGGAYICFYNENRVKIDSINLTTLGGNAISWSSGVAYVRFSIPTNNVVTDKVQIEVGKYPTRYVPYGQFLSDDLIEPKNDISVLFKDLNNSATLANGESLTLPVTYVRANSVLSALIDGTIESIDLGQGDGVYAGANVTITPTNITIGGQTIAHGLTLTQRTVISLIRGSEHKVVIVTSAGDKFETVINNTIMGGAPYIKNNGTSSITATISFFARNITKDIWLIGDSYMGIATTRWPYYIKEWGFDNYLIDNLPGGTSSDAMIALKNDLSCGQPKYMLWALGMNDGTDDTVSNFRTWKKTATEFITLCLERGIEPILATIPTVPNKNHESKNAFVRDSGFRYIDFAKAVNAQSDGTWDAGLLSDDNVHPTEAGAKVLASRVLIDFPEIAYQ